MPVIPLGVIVHSKGIGSLVVGAPGGDDESAITGGVIIKLMCGDVMGEPFIDEFVGGPNNVDVAIKDVGVSVSGTLGRAGFGDRECATAKCDFIGSDGSDARVKDDVMVDSTISNAVGVLAGTDSGDEAVCSSSDEDVRDMVGDIVTGEPANVK